MSVHETRIVAGFSTREGRWTHRRPSVKPWVIALRHLLLVCSGTIALAFYAVILAWLLGLSLDRAWLLGIAALGGVLGFAMSAILSPHRLN